MYSLVFGISIGAKIPASTLDIADIQAHLLNSEIRQVVHRNLKSN